MTLSKNVSDKRFDLKGCPEVEPQIGKMVIAKKNYHPATCQFPKVSTTLLTLTNHRNMGGVGARRQKITETKAMNDFQEKLKQKMDLYAHEVYRLTKKFPKEELYGITSQIRRASLSIVLNYIEGYARKRMAVRVNFLEISYGSLQESKYLLDFSHKEGYITTEEFLEANDAAEEIAKMLWSETARLEKNKN